MCKRKKVKFVSWETDEVETLEEGRGKMNAYILVLWNNGFKTEHRLRSPELGISRAYVTEGLCLEKRLRLYLLYVSGILKLELGQVMLSDVFSEQIIPLNLPT